MGCGVHSKGKTIESHQPNHLSLLPFRLKNYIGPEIETVPGPDPSESPEPPYRGNEAPQTLIQVRTLTSASMRTGAQTALGGKEKTDIEDLEAM